MKNRLKKSILPTIEKNFSSFKKSVYYKKGIKKLNLKKTHRLFEEVKEYYADFINFYVYRRSLKVMKAKRGSLNEYSEKTYVDRGNKALKNYDQMIDRLEEIDKLFLKSGMSKAIAKYAPKVLWRFNYNPKMPLIIEEFRTMGVPEGAIQWLYSEMVNAKFDLLKLGSKEGTFSGIVKKAGAQRNKMVKDMSIVKRYGLPTIQGAGDDADEYAAAGATVAVAIIVGLIFGFCYDWRHTGWPHVKHWDS